MRTADDHPVVEPSPAGAHAVVFIVDDDLSVREALRSLVQSAGLRCQTFGTAAHLLDALRPDTPGCVVVDVQLAGTSGLDVPGHLRDAGLTLPCIFVTGHGTIPMGVQAMKSGAVEFLTKPFREDELLASIGTALARDRAARAARATQRAAQSRLATLTARERDVLRLVVEGGANKNIAAALGTAEQTVKQHRGRVMQKLGATSLAALVRWVERHAPPA